MVLIGLALLPGDIQANVDNRACFKPLTDKLCNVNNNDEKAADISQTKLWITADTLMRQSFVVPPPGSSLFRTEEKVSDSGSTSKEVHNVTSRGDTQERRAEFSTQVLMSQQTHESVVYSRSDQDVELSGDRCSQECRFSLNEVANNCTTLHTKNISLSPPDRLSGLSVDDHQSCKLDKDRVPVRFPNAESCRTPQSFSLSDQVTGAEGKTQHANCDVEVYDSVTSDSPAQSKHNEPSQCAG